jgi:putative ABC transport system permease protein
MKPIEYLKMASKTLLGNKLRSSLTILGIVIGNASVITLVGVGQGTQKLASEQFSALGTNVLFIVPEKSDNWGVTHQESRPLSLDDAQAISSQVPAIKEVSPEIQSMKLATYRNKVTQTRIIGTTPEYLSVRKFDVAKGRFLTLSDIRRNAQVVVLGSELTTKLFGQKNPLGELVVLKNINFLVIGVMESKGSVLGTNLDDTAMIPVTTIAYQILGDTSPYGIELSFIAVSAKNNTPISTAKFQIENLLRQRHKIRNKDDFSIQTQKDLLKTANQITGALTLLLGAIAGISLFVGGIGIMNVMLMSVTERTHEIGLRKAIGASPQDILIQFLIEAIILSILGGLMGIATGMGGNLLIATFTPLKAGVSLLAITITITISGSIGLFFGVVPARRASKLDPIIALRSI